MLGKNSKIYQRWMQEWQRFNNVPFGLDVINIGSAAATNDYDYQYWDLKGYNLASEPQDVYYDSQILEVYINHLKDGGIAIINLLPVDLIVDKYGDEYHNYKYYGFLTSERILNYSKFTDIIIKRFPGLLVNDFIKDEIKTVLKKNKINKTNLQEHAIAMYNSWMKEFGWQDKVNIRKDQAVAIDNSWMLLNQNFDICKKNNKIPMIVILPVNSRLNELLPISSFEKCFWKYIKLAEQRGIPIINLWENEELKKDIYYKNSIMLNDIGKEVFNKVVESRIRKILT